MTETSIATANTSSQPYDELKDPMSGSSSTGSKSSLPSFSFTKRPVDDYIKARASAHEDDQPPSFHSNISDIIPSLSRKNTDGSLITGPARSRAEGSAGTTGSSDGITKYRDINYDEQIRFPRMNNMNYYTYSKGKPGLVHGRPSYSSNLSDISGDSFGSDKKPSTSSSKEDNAEKTTEKEQDSKYKPAAFDLWSPLRRFSVPSEVDTAARKDLKDACGEEDENFKLLREYIMDNYIYEKNSEQAQLNRKIVSFINERVGSDPQHPFYTLPATSRANNGLGIGVKPPTLAATGRRPSKMKKNPDCVIGPQKCDVPASFAHLHQLKKPLSTPAVLRPNKSSTGESNSPTRLVTNQPSSSNSNSGIPNSIYTVTSPVAFNQGIFSLESVENESRLPDSPPGCVSPSSGFNVEPTHIHWKPNNYSSHCMQCFKSFGNSILSLLYLFFDDKKRKETTNEVSPTNNDGVSTSSTNSLSSNHRRRHHCRFCGFIYCDSCLIQGDGEEAEKFDNPERLYATPNGRFVGRGILLDQGARFVIPIYKNLDNPMCSAQTSLITNPENYKLYKICKNCGDIYKNLVLDLNKAATEAAEQAEQAGTEQRAGAMSEEAPAILQRFPFVFIENPYVNAIKLQKMTGSKPSQPNVPFTSEHPPKLEHAGRKSWTTEVPTDWTWSSF